MKATGIVRRIDDLGRVVIPKEIRRTMRIREGDPLEIYTDNEGEVIFKKYSPMGELGPYTKQYVDVLNRTSGLAVVICDRDQVIAVSGNVCDRVVDTQVPQSSIYVFGDSNTTFTDVDAELFGLNVDECAIVRHAFDIAQNGTETAAAAAHIDAVVKAARLAVETVDNIRI